MTASDSVALRLQQLPTREQVLVLAQMAEARSKDGRATPADVTKLFEEFALPAPARVANFFTSLATTKLLTKTPARGKYRVTPLGRTTANELLSHLDVAALVAESAAYKGSELGHAIHTVVPPSLAPPELIEPLRAFLDAHPFETNVFGMTRFADATAGDADPVAKALSTAREVCQSHGLEFHLASDRSIHDDLWTNIAGHMWASRYGVGLFEDLADRGLNHNLLIEVGGMLITGRRCALLKDGSLDRMPTDLVGRIYKSVDLADTDVVASTLHRWIRDDLDLGSCSSCP